MVSPFVFVAIAAEGIKEANVVPSIFKFTPFFFN
jgi:hypothetical protein